MTRQYYNFDEVWGNNAEKCVKELLDMEGNTSGRYVALGPTGYADSQSEMNSVMADKTRKILEKYGCHIRKLGDTDEDLKKRGELDAYRQYEKLLMS